MVREADLQAVHGVGRRAAHVVDLAVARVAVPFAGVREAPTWAVADRLGREVVAAALVR